MRPQHEPHEAQTASVNDLKRYSHVVTKVGHFDTKCGHFVAWRNLPLLREPILLQNGMSCRDLEETSMMALDSRQWFAHQTHLPWIRMKPYWYLLIYLLIPYNVGHFHRLRADIGWESASLGPTLGLFDPFFWGPPEWTDPKRVWDYCYCRDCSK
jgi:hypothetical protein